jgi:hypothetical protein
VTLFRDNSTWGRTCAEDDLSCVFCLLGLVCPSVSTRWQDLLQVEMTRSSRGSVEKDKAPSFQDPISYEDLTVRQAINRLVHHMGERGSWAFSGSADFRAFAFNRQGFLLDSYN